MSNIIRTITLIIVSLLFVACDAAGEPAGSYESVVSQPASSDVAVPDALTALDTVLAYLQETYGERAPWPEMAWKAEQMTPEGVVGANTIRFTSGSCVAIVGYPMVAPEAIVYQVNIDDRYLDFYWAGQVDAAGVVVEQGGEMPLPAVVAPSPDFARQAAIDAVRAAFPELLMPPDLPFTERVSENIQLVGYSTYEYADGDWRAFVAFPLVAPENTLYEVTLINEAIQFEWAGQVNALREVSQFSGPEKGVSNFAAEADWLTFRNPAWGYSLLYPPATEVMGLDLNEWVAFEGPLVDNSRWPRISISHYQDEFYHPPEGVDLVAWVQSAAETTFGEEDGAPGVLPVSQHLGSQVQVAGVPAVHVFTPPTDSADGYDEYYFLGGDHLFRIMFVHSGGRQDWAMIYKFLGAFAFDEEPAPCPPPTRHWRGVIQRQPPGSQTPYLLETLVGQTFSLGAVNDLVQGQIDRAAWTGVQVDLWGQESEISGHLNVTHLEAGTKPANDVHDLTPFAVASASSELPADRMGTYHAWSAVDGQTDSPWCEGAEGPGVGQSLQLDFERPLEVIRLSLFNGYDSGGLFQANGRVRRLKVIFSNGEELLWDIEDRSGMQAFVLARAPGPPIETTTIRLVIEDVYPGTTYDDTCLGEFAVWGFGR